mmetsp:Transcript_13053/g.22026  ORF Transcript_13053/g.22026 Transcript_13053/m.22026 type:complete len:84 (-) Transcript_13053:97-348(-)
MEFFKELAFGLDQVFDKTGLSFIPKPLRYCAVILLVLSPLIALIVMILTGDDDEVSAPRTQQKPKDASKVNDITKLAESKKDR